MVPDSSPRRERLDAFRRSLAELGVACTHASPGECREVVADLVRAPAVGVALDGVDASLPDAVATDPTPAELEAAATGVTPAVMGVADYGSVLLQADAGGTEPVSVYPEFHVAVLSADDVVADMPAAFAELGPRIRESRGSVVFATGPSATADMGDLVTGAHGPREVHVVLVDGAAGDAGHGSAANESRSDAASTTDESTAAGEPTDAEEPTDAGGPTDATTGEGVER